jgi:hypothetical protein
MKSLGRPDPFYCTHIAKYDPDLYRMIEELHRGVVHSPIQHNTRFAITRWTSAMFASDDNDWVFHYYLGVWRMEHEKIPPAVFIMI